MDSSWPLTSSHLMEAIWFSPFPSLSWDQLKKKSPQMYINWGLKLPIYSAKAEDGGCGLMSYSLTGWLCEPQNYPDSITWSKSALDGNGSPKWSKVMTWRTPEITNFLWALGGKDRDADMSSPISLSQMDGLNKSQRDQEYYATLPPSQRKKTVGRGGAPDGGVSS